LKRLMPELGDVDAAIVLKDADSREVAPSWQRDCLARFGLIARSDEGDQRNLLRSDTRMARRSAQAERRA